MANFLIRTLLSLLLFVLINNQTIYQDVAGFNKVTRTSLFSLKTIEMNPQKFMIICFFFFLTSMAAMTRSQSCQLGQPQNCRKGQFYCKPDQPKNKTSLGSCVPLATLEQACEGEYRIPCASGLFCRYPPLLKWLWGMANKPGKCRKVVMKGPGITEWRF